MKRTMLAVAAATLLASCGSYTQSSEALWRDTPDYAAMRQALPPARAYAYGDTTVLEFPQGGTPAWIRIRDQAGADVPFEQLGRYFRIARPMDRFTAWINGVPREFVVLGVSAQSDALPQPQKLLPAPPARIQGSRATGTLTMAELRTELEEVRSRVDELQASKSARPQDWRAVTRKLDALEQRIDGSARFDRDRHDAFPLNCFRRRCRSTGRLLRPEAWRRHIRTRDRSARRRSSRPGDPNRATRSRDWSE